MEESDEFEMGSISKTSSYERITSYWTLNRFSSLSKNICKRSPEFPSSEENNKWFLIVELNETDSNYVDIVLTPADTFDQKSISVRFSLTISNSKTSTHFNTRTFTKPFIGIKYPLGKVSVIRECIKSDKLEIRISVQRNLNHEKKCLNYKNYSSLGDKDNSSDALIHDFQSTSHVDNDNSTAALIHDFQSMLFCRDYSDFTIKVEDEEIAVHKIVLTSRSPVFRAMLQNDLLEAKEGFVKITDFSKKTISALIKFMYTIKVDIESNEEAKQLFLAADKYDVLSLKQLCENYLLHNCNAEILFDLLVFAEDNNAVNLQKRLLDYIAENKHHNLSFKRLESLKLSDPRQTFLKNLIAASRRE